MTTCNKCGKSYKVLTEEGLCYYCHVNKYGNPPKTGLYKPGEQRPMSLGGKRGKRNK